MFAHHLSLGFGWAEWVESWVGHCHLATMARRTRRFVPRPGGNRFNFSVVSERVLHLGDQDVTRID